MPKVVLTSSQLWSNVLWYTIGSVTWLLENFSRLEGLGLTDDTIVNLNLQQYRPYIYSSSEDFKFRGDTQARSQDWYRGGVQKPKKWKFFTPKVDFVTQPPCPLERKKPLFLVHLMMNNGLFCLQKPYFWSILWQKGDHLVIRGKGWCDAPTAPPGYVGLEIPLENSSVWPILFWHVVDFSNFLH